MPARRTARPSALLAAALVLAACDSGGSPNEGAAPDDREETAASAALACAFDGPSGALPEGWRVGTTHPREGSEDARWELVADATAPSPPGALALVDAREHEGRAFNLCWTPALTLADVDVTVAVHADDGVEDQGGGPAWRIAGADDYYLARWNPLEDNFRVYSVKDGERLQLDSARVRVDPGTWHTIRARHVGDSITCWFDGEELLHATDAELTAAGHVGLWTKADATTRFDDLVVTAAR